jgi:hypothetical protein
MRAPLLAALACLALALPAAADDDPAVTVTGHGTAAAQPDMATLGVGVETRAATAAAALAENSGATARVIERLKASGVPAADIATSDLSISPIRRHDGDDPARIEAFRVVNRVTARIGDLDGLGALLDRVVRDGANRIDRLSFGIADPAPLEAEARAAAIADARAAAEAYAGAAGLALGPVLSIRDAAAPAPRPGGLSVARAEAMPAVPIEPGTAEIAARVTVVWALEESD